MKEALMKAYFKAQPENGLNAANLHRYKKSSPFFQCVLPAVLITSLTFAFAPKLHPQPIDTLRSSSNINPAEQKIKASFDGQYVKIENYVHSDGKVSLMLEIMIGKNVLDAVCKDKERKAIGFKSAGGRLALFFPYGVAVLQPMRSAEDQIVFFALPAELASWDVSPSAQKPGDFTIVLNSKKLTLSTNSRGKITLKEEGK